MHRAIRVALVGALVQLPFPLRAQDPTPLVLRPRTVRSCREAESLFGRMWRSQVSRIPAYYDRPSNQTILTTPLRSVSWQIGSSRVAGMDLRTQLPGKGVPGTPLSITLSLRLVDTVLRTGSELPVSLMLNDTLPFELHDPDVAAVANVGASGVPQYVSYSLTPEELRTFAGAKKAEGTIGPHRFFFYDWELLDLNAVYRAMLCGVDL